MNENSEPHVLLERAAITGVPGSIKRPDESRTWFNYPGQSSQHALSQIKAPAKIARAVEDETGALTWQMTQNSYDPDFGNLTHPG